MHTFSDHLHCPFVIQSPSEYHDAGPHEHHTKRRLKSRHIQVCTNLYCPCLTPSRPEECSLQSSSVDDCNWWHNWNVRIGGFNIPLDTQLLSSFVPAFTRCSGLFVGSGEALELAGPLGLLLGYLIMGTIVYSGT
jgi:hypothetical protein